MRSRRNGICPREPTVEPQVNTDARAILNHVTPSPKSRDLWNSGLVSTTESIDEMPSGMLLHSTMSSIAEFYSRNLAAEVVKGMSQNPRAGGTNGRVPVGYRNHRNSDEQGREPRTVIVHPEPSPLIVEAFNEYATGRWTISILTNHLAMRGRRHAPHR